MLITCNNCLSRNVMRDQGLKIGSRLCQFLKKLKRDWTYKEASIWTISTWNESNNFIQWEMEIVTVNIHSMDPKVPKTIWIIEKLYKISITLEIIVLRMALRKMKLYLTMPRNKIITEMFNPRNHSLCKEIVIILVLIQKEKCLWFWETLIEIQLAIKCLKAILMGHRHIKKRKNFQWSKSYQVKL